MVDQRREHPEAIPKEIVSSLYNFFCQDLESANHNAKKCWVNGDDCPYGSPNGKFSEAPLDSCKGCHIAGNYEAELKDLLGLKEKVQLEEDELKQNIREDIAISSVSVQCLLGELAEDVYPDEAQKELKNILKEFIKVINHELRLEDEMVVREDEVLSNKKQEVKNEK